MNSENKDESVDWSQITDLIGDEGDTSQHAMLADMWRDMRADIRKDWIGLDQIMDETELKRVLHRLRGVVAMWGLGELAAHMQTIENEPESVQAWRRRSGALAIVCDRSIAAITARFPWLESAAS